MSNFLFQFLGTDHRNSVETRDKNTTKIPRWHQKKLSSSCKYQLSQHGLVGLFLPLPFCNNKYAKVKVNLREKTLLSPPVSEQKIFESKEKTVVRWTKPGPKQTLRKTKITAQCVVSPKNWKPTQLSTQKSIFFGGRDFQLSKSSKKKLWPECRSEIGHPVTSTNPPIKKFI